jgi:lipid-binding SYLF domain-containing protein
MLCGLAEALPAQTREERTVEAASDVLADLARIPEQAIPPALLHDAHGVAIIPNVIKAGFLVGGSHGRGVVLLREADGSWSNPIFVSLTGGSIGWQVGVQSTDVVLVFKSRRGLQRILDGRTKLTLGADAAVAAGPVGRRTEAATDVQLKSEIYSYSRSRGLFAGVSLEGAGMVVDCSANDAFYRVRGGRPVDVLNLRGVPIPAVVVRLRDELTRMSGLPAAPVQFAPPQPVPGQPLPAPTPLPQPRLTPEPAPLPLPQNPQKP